MDHHRPHRRLDRDSLLDRLRSLTRARYLGSAFLVAGLGAACAPPPAEAPADTQPTAALYPIGTPDNFTDPEYSTASFRSIEAIFPTRRVARSGPVSPLERATAPFDVTYPYDGQTYDAAQFAERTDTTGLLILHGDTILHEAYYRGADETSRFLSMSVGKSFVSTLIGIAVGAGSIESVHDPVTRYLPELAGSGYDGVAIEHVLQMSSGVDFTEEYEDRDSDVFRLADAALRGKGRVNEVAASFGRAREPGSKFYYASNDTQILGMLLQRVSGKTPSDFMAEELWGPLGAESDAAWIIDLAGPDGVEMAFGGLNVTLRDYGRLGLLMARDGVWRGEQLLPAGWVAAATVPASEQVLPGKLYDDYALGYQYQWWCFPGPDHAFTGQGVFGQFLMVNPVLDLVLVKTSAWPDFWDPAKESELYALFGAVSERLRANSNPSA